VVRVSAKQAAATWSKHYYYGHSLQDSASAAMPEIVAMDLKPTFSWRHKTQEVRAREAKGAAEAALASVHAAGGAASLAKLGLKLFLDAATTDEEVAILHGLCAYNKRYGLTVEEDHFIQRDSVKLETAAARAAAHRIFCSLVPALDVSADEELASLVGPRDLWLRQIASLPAFNYYPPGRGSSFSPHYDNLFGAPQVMVLNLGSTATVRFRNWLKPHDDAFTILLPPRAAYAMSRHLRYEYTHGGGGDDDGDGGGADDHGGTPGGHASGSRPAARPTATTLTTAVPRVATEERVSLVWGLPSLPLHMSEFSSNPAYVWGESDTRWQAERFWGGKLDLEGYLGFVEWYLRLKNRMDQRDSLQPHIQALKGSAQRRFL
jgi:hypothetical protein